VNKQALLRSLPAVDKLLKEQTLQKLLEEFPRKLVIKETQELLEQYRHYLLSFAGDEQDFSFNFSSAALAEEITSKVREKNNMSLRRVINATGTIIHTNLGRAPLAKKAEEALLSVSSGYSNLELSLEKGERGSRQSHVENLLCDLTGAEGAVVVNNNAAAVFLVLQALAFGKEIIISRGELVEIGGSFRMPDVMSSSGVYMKEVGTTNKCYISDYEEAITDQTSVLLKVHTSNYRIVGFTKEVNRSELVELGQKAGIPVVEDLGSGSLINLEKYGLSPEPTVQECLQQGVSLVTFSGDKLLGGPQAGIIAGKKELVNKIKRNQIARALRVDKFTVAALEATLRLYWDEEQAINEIPVLSMLTHSESQLKNKAHKLYNQLVKEVASAKELTLIKDSSTVGGGAFPLEELSTYVIKFNPSQFSSTSLAKRLRQMTPPVLGRIHQDALYFDVRTLLEGEEFVLAEKLQEAVQEELKDLW